MDIRRIVPNISSNSMEESRQFYGDFLGLHVVMDMEWIITFASATNPFVQISIIKNDKPNVFTSDISISIEVKDIEPLYKKAIDLGYEITYPISNEPWGVRRFFVKDPNNVTINIMCHLPSSK